MATPAFQAVGTQVASRAALTVAWPTHLADDIGLLVIETSGQGTTLSITAPAGWAAVPGSPVVDVASSAGSKLQVWWKRAASAAETSVSVPDSGNHQIARIFTFRHCITTGNPWDVTTTGGKASASTTATVPAVTTTVADTLIAMIVGRPNDNASTFHFGVPVNANLTSLAECGEAGSTQGNGGGFVVSRGIKALAGSTGTSTLTKIASTTDTYMVIAFKGVLPPAELICNTGTFAVAGVNVHPVKSSTIHGTTQTYSVVGNDVDLTKSASLDVDAGAFTLSGTTTGLLFNRNLIQQLGTFSVVGQNLLLQKAARLGITTGSYAVDGVNVALTKHLCIDGITSSYSLVGNSALLQRAVRIDATVGTYSLVGNSTLLQREVRIDATVGTYDFVGTTTGLLQNRQLVSQAGTFSISGVQIELIYTPIGNYFTLDNQTGTFAVAGILADLNKQFKLNTQTGSYASVGNTLGFIRALALYSVPGSFSVSGKDAVLSLTRSFDLTTGTYTVSGNNADVVRFYQLNNQPGTYQVVGLGLDSFSDRNLVTLPLDIVADFKSIGNFFWYQTTQTIQPVKYKITKRNEFILGRQTHMGRRGL